MAVFVKGEATKTLVEKNLGEGKIPLPPLTEKPPTMVLVFKARIKKKGRHYNIYSYLIGRCGGPDMDIWGGWMVGNVGNFGVAWISE